MEKEKSSWKVIVDSDVEYSLKKLTLDEDATVAVITDKFLATGTTITAEFSNEDLKNLMPLILTPEISDEEKNKLDADECVEALASFLAKKIRQKVRVTNLLVTSATGQPQP